MPGAAVVPAAAAAVQVAVVAFLSESAFPVSPSLVLLLAGVMPKRARPDVFAATEVEAVLGRNYVAAAAGRSQQLIAAQMQSLAVDAFTAGYKHAKLVVRQ